MDPSRVEESAEVPELLQGTLDQSCRTHERDKNVGYAKHAHKRWRHDLRRVHSKDWLVEMGELAAQKSCGHVDVQPVALPPHGMRLS